MRKQQWRTFSPGDSPTRRGRISSRSRTGFGAGSWIRRNDVATCAGVGVCADWFLTLCAPLWQCAVHKLWRTKGDSWELSMALEPSPADVPLITPQA